MAKSRSNAKGILKGVQLGSFLLGQRTLSAVASSYANDVSQMSIQLWSDEGPYGRLTTFAGDPLLRPLPWQVAVKIGDENEALANAALSSNLFASHRAVDDYTAIASLNLEALPIEVVGQLSDELGWKVTRLAFIRLLVAAAKVVNATVDLRDGEKELDPSSLVCAWDGLTLRINEEDVLAGYEKLSAGEIIQNALRLMSDSTPEEAFVVQRG